MDYEFMRYPTKIKEIAGEIISACNHYKARKINNDKLQEVILFYAKNYPEKVFDQTDLNPTIKKIIGKHRIEMIQKILK